MMVSEAEKVLNDVLKSISELKELLVFSAEQQTAVCLLDFVNLCALMEHLPPVTIGITFIFPQGLLRSLTSAQVISKTSIDFFQDIRVHVSRLNNLMEQNHIERSSQLVDFEKEFKVVGLATLYAIYFIYGQTL